MAGGDPAPVPPDVHQHVHEDVQEVQQADPLLSSFRDRSVSEIETSFSEHFIPAVEEEGAEADGGYSSNSCNGGEDHPEGSQDDYDPFNEDGLEDINGQPETEYERNMFDEPGEKNGSTDE